MEFIHDLRAWSKTPILVLTARTKDEDKGGALDAGADDYLIKPFSVAELLARVRAVCCRYEGEPDGDAVVSFGAIQVGWSYRLDYAAFRRC